MNYRNVAVCCALFAYFTLHSNADDPERTSWTLADTKDGHSIHVQIQYLSSPSRLWPELWFDTKYSDIPLNPGTRFSVAVYRGDELVDKDGSSIHELRMAGRVLIWKSVDNSLLPDTSAYRVELHVDGVRFPMPNTMAAHFTVKVDGSWDFDRIEPPIVIEDSLHLPDTGSFDFRFQLPPPNAPRFIPIPPSDPGGKAVPIPPWDGKRDIIPLPRTTPKPKIRDASIMR